MNVIVLALRGCPVGALGAYGNEWIATPNLDRLAAEGVVFDRHLSDCPEAEAARRAWRTGRHQAPALPQPLPPTPSPKWGGGAGVGLSFSSPRFGEGLPPPQDLLALLRSRGVRTALIRHTRVANDAPPEFYAGWDDLFNARPDPTDSFPSEALLRIVPTVLNCLVDAPHWLLWIELDRLLPPWDISQDVFEIYVEDLIESDDPDSEPVLPWTEPPEGWFDRDDLVSWELLHRSFAAVVSVFDADLGRLFDLLRERGLDRDAAWVLTADHGLPLGEHRVTEFIRPWLHEELVHVPLIVRLPDGAEAGRRVAALTQPADLMPTLAGWLGESVSAEGVNLMPLMRGEVDSVRAHACSGLTLDGMSEWAIRTPEWAFLLPGEPQPDGDEPRAPMLFEKPDDRWEVNDVRSQHPEVSEALEQTLRAVLSQDPNPQPG